ncbi:MAG: hypothetical protein Q8O93_02570 [bacterium]|nr:hypothetical protein [bacterium]
MEWNNWPFLASAALLLINLFILAPYYDKLAKQELIKQAAADLKRRLKISRYVKKLIRQRDKK